jgi:hypothetical protein
MYLDSYAGLAAFRQTAMILASSMFEGEICPGNSYEFAVVSNLSDGLRFKLTQSWLRFGD